MRQLTTGDLNFLGYMLMLIGVLLFCLGFGLWMVKDK